MSWRRGRSVAEAMAQWLPLMPEDERERAWRALGPVAATIRHEWKFWARPQQMAPPADWSTWLILAGRGFGKTRAGAEYIRGWAERDPAARIALVGATFSDTLKVMVEGESGLVAIAPDVTRPRYEAGRRRLMWPNGAQAFLYSAEEPDQLRGPEHQIAWCDELCKFAYPDALWINLRLGLRLGDRPRVIVTTTPRPMKLLHEIIAEAGTHVSRGATRDNARNLPPAFIARMEAVYAGTRLGRQELEGEIVEDVAGALWNRAALDGGRVAVAPPPMRVVVAVDPPAGAGASSDACGIVVVAKGADGRGYVLADRTVQGLSPEGWARAVVAAAGDFAADRVVAEVNNGGAMVESVLRGVDAELPVKCVRASHGKVARAEPVAALYEAGRVSHVGAMAALEDQLVGMIAGGVYAGPGRSPDRADALVWALTELMLGGREARPLVRRL